MQGQARRGGVVPTRRRARAALDDTGMKAKPGQASLRIYGCSGQWKWFLDVVDPNVTIDPDSLDYFRTRALARDAARYVAAQFRLKIVPAKE